MTKRAAVTHQALVRDATNFRVVKDGVAREVVRALKVCNGVACEFWPRTDFSTEEVVWTTEEVTSLDIQTDPIDAQAAIQFLLSDGNAYIDNTPPGGTLPVPYVSPPINATEKLLLRWNTVTGTLSSNVTENVWFDMYSNGGAFIAAVFIDQTVPGVNLASADIDIADDTGGGVPGTIVTKRVNFHAEVTHATDVLLSTLQWDLEHFAIDADGETTITLDLDAVLRGFEGPALVLAENYGITGVNTALFTAQLDLISGDAPTSGPALGAPHSLGVAISWALTADTDLDDFSGEYDLTVVGPSESVTKRVTMHVTRLDDPSFIEPAWNNPTDIEQGNLSATDNVVLDHNIDGTADITANGFTDPAGWPQNWHTGAPTPDAINYEVNMVVNGPMTGSPINTWLPANVAYQWAVGFATQFVDQVSVEAMWTYRQVGRPSTEVAKPVNIALYRNQVP